MLSTVGTGSLLLLLQGLGDAIGGPLRALSVLGPRDRFGSGPNGFAVNRTALAAQIGPEEVDASWALELSGARSTIHLSRARLLALPQHPYELPIACVEGWSTTQRWTGVPVRDLAALVGMRGKLTLDTNSIEQNGVFGSASLGSEEVADERTLLALRVNGADLSLDHGFPARIIGPALPGVHCTKWVAQMSFRPAEGR
jgi:DMSO/TMAO reductase YedYZ molybdopterin-dependent catalytic subunit